MKFGIFFIGDNYPAERSNLDFYAELLDQVVYAEELGFDSVWFAEHHFHDRYGVCPSPAVLMAAGALTGGYLSVGVARRLGAVWLRRAVIGFGLVVAIILLVRL